MGLGQCVQPACSHPSLWVCSLPGDGSQQPGEDPQLESFSRNGMGQTGSAPLVSHPAPKTRSTRLAAAAESCPQPTQGLVPSSELAVPSAHGHGTLLPSSAHPITAELIPTQLHTEHTTQVRNAPVTTEPSQHPRCSRAIGRGQQAGTGPAGGETAMEQRSSERA